MDAGPNALECSGGGRRVNLPPLGENRKKVMSNGRLAALVKRAPVQTTTGSGSSRMPNRP